MTEYEMLPEDAKVLKEELGKHIQVSDHFLQCVSVLSKTFADRLSMNAYIVSIINEMKKKETGPDTDWEPEVPTEIKDIDNLDERGIDRSISILVQKFDWVNKEKETNKAKNNEKKQKGYEYKLVSPNDVHPYMGDQDFENKYKYFRSTIGHLTEERVTMGTHDFNQVIRYLKVWRQVVEWVNNGLGSGKRVDLDGFDGEDEINALRETTKTYLRKILEQEFVKTGIRNLLHAESVNVKDKLDEMFQGYRRLIATEQPKFTMILGITQMGKRQRRNKKGNKSPEVVTTNNKDKLTDKLLDDIITVSQQKRCWEIQEMIVEDTSVVSGRKEMNLITATLSNATAKRGKTNTPTYEARDKDNKLWGTHIHRRDNWNDRDWLRRDVSEMVGRSKLSLVVVENEWEDITHKKKKKENQCYFQPKYQRSFFQHTLPGLLKYSLLSEDACIYLPMNEWFFLMIHVLQTELKVHYTVDFVGQCKDIEEGHENWLSTLAKDNTEAKYQSVENGNVDDFLQRLRSLKNKNLNEINNSYETYANGFFHLEHNEFTAIKWIRLKPKKPKNQIPTILNQKTEMVNQSILHTHELEFRLTRHCRGWIGRNLEMCWCWDCRLISLRPLSIGHAHTGTTTVGKRQLRMS